jgi:hypothetical protein
MMNHIAADAARTPKVSFDLPIFFNGRSSFVGSTENNIVAKLIIGKGGKDQFRAAGVEPRQPELPLKLID